MTYHTNPSVLNRCIFPHNYIYSLESPTSIVSKNRHHPTLRKGHKTPLPKREPLYCGSFLDRTHRATLIPALVIRIPGYPNTDPLISYYGEKKYKPRNQPSKTLGTFPLNPEIPAYLSKKLWLLNYILCVENRIL